MLAKIEFQRRFLNIFEKKYSQIFIFFSFFQALFKRWVNNKLNLDKSSLLHIFYYILYYTTIPSLLNRDDGDSNPYEKFWTSIAKTELWPITSGRPRAILNMHFFVLCQIDVENKQLFSPLSWNNPLPK